MDKVCTIITKLSMKETFVMDSKTVSAFKNLTMAIIMLGSTSMVFLKAMVSIIGKMEAHTKEIFQMVLDMAMAYGRMKTKLTLAPTKTIIKKALASILGETKKSIKDSSGATTDQDMVKCIP